MFGPGCQKNRNCFCTSLSRRQNILMSQAFDCLRRIFLVMTASAIVLSVCIGVGGWRCPISSNVMRMGMASLALIYNAPILASAADVITDLMICAMFKTAPLFGGNCVLFDM